MKSLASKVFVVFCLLAAVMTWSTAVGQEGKKRKNDPSAQHQEEARGGRPARRPAREVQQDRRRARGEDRRGTRPR